MTLVDVPFMCHFNFLPRIHCLQSEDTISVSIVNAAHEKIEALVKSNVFVPANNLTHFHNLIFVRKKDRSLRLTTDLRPTNKITVKATNSNKSLRKMLRSKEAGFLRN
uniref:MSP domain-containing protein n=1 Tax=Strongyloides venezuelensis TaxID=75913 RepID=A0A0K0FJV5_STRVS